MILVTGSTGLLGSRLLFDLTSQGHVVKAMRRKSSRMGCIDYYFATRPDLMQKIEWCEGDVNDYYSIDAAMSGVEYVYHCAGKVSFQPGDRNIIDRVNVDGTANVVNLCLDKGIKKFCHVSSVAALGRTELSNVIDENAVWKTSPENSIYAISKYGAEREVWRGVAEGLNAVIVNPGLILGPGNWKTDSTMIFGEMWKGLKFYTAGVNGLVDVSDVSKVMIQLMNSNIVNERYVLVSESKPLRDVFDRIADNFGKKRPSIYAGPLLTELAWRFEFVKSLFTGSKPVITRETAISARGKNYYSSEKIKKAIGMNFMEISKSIDLASAAFLKWVSKPN
jgi:dihydroflavonol-4-reductase